MVFKIELGHGKRTAHLEADSEPMLGKKIGEKIAGEELSPTLSGYELQITGASDKAGFPSYEKVEGPGLKRVLFDRGFSLHKIRKKKKTANRRKLRKGFRKRRTVRGNTISADTVQINFKVLKEGNQKFDELFPVKQKEVKQATA